MLPPKRDEHVRSVELAHKISEEMCRHFCKRIRNCGLTDEPTIFSTAVIAIVRLIQALDDEDPNGIKPYGLLSEHVVLLLTEPEKVIAGRLTAAELPELRARFPELDVTEAQLAEIMGRAA
jgi:hypothetical protein